MRFMLHAVIDHLGLTPEKTTILTGSGSHWPHTEEELQDLFCRRIYPVSELFVTTAGRMTTSRWDG